MDNIKAMQVFVEVHDQGGFAPAARKLKLSTSAASRYVAGLEQWLGVQLFHRTTRQLHLTPQGDNLLTHCKRILADIHELKSKVKETRDEPQGSLRITAPVYLTKYWLSKVIAAYIREHPKVHLEMIIVDRNVNLVEEGFDLAIRAGRLTDSSLKSRRIGTTRTKLVASPAYIKTNGRPASPDELKKHTCIVDTVPSYGERWPLDGKSYRRGYMGKKILEVNSGEIACDMAVAGLGITFLPDFIVEAALQQKQLVSLLDEYVNRESGIFVLYPDTSYVSANVRSFIDFISDRFFKLHSR